jgi:hypothetical protein
VRYGSEELSIGIASMREGGLSKMNPRNGTQGGIVRAAWIATMLGSVLLACASSKPSLGDGTNDNNPEPGTTNNASSSGSANSSSSSSGGSNTSSSGATGDDGGVVGSSSGSTIDPPDAIAPPSSGPADAAAIDPAFVGETQTLSASFLVPAGQEVYKCQAFPNPFKADVDLIHYDGTMTKGSHHFFLFNLDPFTALQAPTGSMQNCPSGGTEIHPFGYLSQQPHWVTQYPTDTDGSPMGYRIASGNSLELNVHFVNATAASIMASVSITITSAKSGVVKTHVGTLFLDDSKASISGSASPQATTGSWSGNPGAVSSDGSYQIYQSWSHMHQWGTDFKTSINGGQMFYNETNWSEPQVFWHMPGYTATNSKTATGATSPVAMTSAQGLSWTCDWTNTTGKSLSFGPSAEANIMCIYVGEYYPANLNAPDVLYSTASSFGL